MTDKIQVSIETINRLAKDGAEVDELKWEIHNLLSLAPNSIASIHHPGVTLYRGTKHHSSVPTRMEEIWYPPAEKTLWNRANRPQRPMFYCTSDPDCALREIGAGLGDTVVFATWTTKANMMLHDLGFSSQVLSRAGSRRVLPELHKSFYTEKLSVEGRTVRDFIAFAFTEPSPKDYRLTVALAEMHLRAEEFAGILYPSVAKDANTDNVALLPEYVRNSLSLVTAQVFQADQVESDGRVSGRILFELQAVSERGDLSWNASGSGPSDTLPPGRGQAIRPGEKLRVETQGEVEIDGQRYHLEAGYSIQIENRVVVVRDLQDRILQPLK
jgi:hypothetical protein